MARHQDAARRVAARLNELRAPPSTSAASGFSTNDVLAELRAPRAASSKWVETGVAITTASTGRVGEHIRRSVVVRRTRGIAPARLLEPVFARVADA